MVPQLIIGLGNPGREYEQTRHNAGFCFVDALALKLGVSFSAEAKFFAHLTRVRVKDFDLWLLKPTTFMNHSGKSVAAVANYYKIPPQAMLVAHDDLDLLPGDVRLKVGGGHGGHNGLRDIIKALGSQQFTRLRLGIGHPNDRNQVANFVLDTPSQAEQDALEGAIARALAVMDLVLADKLALAMNQLHTKPQTKGSK